MFKIVDQNRALLVSASHVRKGMTLEGLSIIAESGEEYVVGIFKTREALDRAFEDLLEKLNKYPDNIAYVLPEVVEDHIIRTPEGYTA
jgi:hypothetical protein